MEEKVEKKKVKMGKIHEGKGKGNLGGEKRKMRVEISETQGKREPRVLKCKDKIG